MTKRKGTTK